MEVYLTCGNLPNAEEVRDFLQNLAVDELLVQAGEAGRAFLRDATLFHLPIPEPVLQLLADERGEDIVRLRSLGLLDPFEDLVDADVTALAVNALAAGRLRKLEDAEAVKAAEIATRPLFLAWGAAAGRMNRPFRRHFARAPWPSGR